MGWESYISSINTPKPNIARQSTLSLSIASASLIAFIDLIAYSSSLQTICRLSMPTTMLALARWVRLVAIVLVAQSIDRQLCHGPMSSPVSTSFASAPASPAEKACHSHCVTFACPGCVEKVSPAASTSNPPRSMLPFSPLAPCGDKRLCQNRDSYQIINLKNHIYDYHCGPCMADVVVPQSRRGSVESNVDPLDSRQVVF